jgi:hypothetical protein
LSLLRLSIVTLGAANLFQFSALFPFFDDRAFVLGATWAAAVWMWLPTGAPGRRARVAAPFVFGLVANLISAGVRWLAGAYPFGLPDGPAARATGDMLDDLGPVLFLAAMMFAGASVGRDLRAFAREPKASFRSGALIATFGVIALPTSSEIATALLCVAVVAAIGAATEPAPEPAEAERSIAA